VVSRPLNAGRIVAKETNLSYHLEKVFDIDIPALHHGNDGLIYTRVSTPYTPGTDHNMYARFSTAPLPPFSKPLLSLLVAHQPPRLKWKPPFENSIDFKLVLRFPPLGTNLSQPDLYAKPVFALYAWSGGEGPKAAYEQYDVMYVTDDEWERCVSHLENAGSSPHTLWTHSVSPFARMKVSGEQFEDRIVEVCWDPAVDGWRMMRFRDDKPTGNHISTVEKVILSIRDGVEKKVVSTIRTVHRGTAVV
jgi:mRNA guanylyltransferase